MQQICAYDENAAACNLQTAVFFLIALCPPPTKIHFIHCPLEPKLHFSEKSGFILPWGFVK